MNAFISYSVSDQDLYLITLLSKKLREKNYSLSTGANIFSHTLDFTTTQQILSSQLFIGIISINGMQRNRVFDEWRFSMNNRIPSVLLIEEGVQVTGGANTYVRFNRNNPHRAIEEIQRRMDSNKSNKETLGWLLGGAALLALLAALSGTKK